MKSGAEDDAAGILAAAAPAASPDTVCWEANVVTFNGGNALASTNNISISTGYPAGWMDLYFPGGATTIYIGNYHELQ